MINTLLRTEFLKYFFLIVAVLKRRINLYFLLFFRNFLSAKKKVAEKHFSAFCSRNWKDSWLILKMIFFDTLTRTKWKSFSKKKQVKVFIKGTEIILKAVKNYSSMVTLISQSQDIDMWAVLSHPLSLIPLALAVFDSTVKNTSKVNLGHVLEKPAWPVDEILVGSVCIVDRMSLAKKLKGSHVYPMLYSAKHHWIKAKIKTVIRSLIFNFNRTIKNP